MSEPTIIAVDWSGAKKTGPKSGIWLAVVQGGRVVHSAAVGSREKAVGLVQAFDSPVIAGFDFSFGTPRWFATANGCTTVDEMWSLAERDGERWLAEPPAPPFWRKECLVPLDRRFRRCEERLRESGPSQPKSIFQLVGVGMVGPGSVRGMPRLPGLRASGFAIWPFDDASRRTAVEIYPSLLRKLAPHQAAGPFSNDHERDAVVSARVMWEHRESLAALRAATHPVTVIEGDVWVPPSTNAATTSGPPSRAGESRPSGPPDLRLGSD